MTKSSPFDRQSAPPGHTLPRWGKSTGWRDFTPEEREHLYSLSERWGCESPSEVIAEIARDYLAESLERARKSSAAAERGAKSHGNTDKN